MIRWPPERLSPHPALQWHAAAARIKHYLPLALGFLTWSSGIKIRTSTMWFSQSLLCINDALPNRRIMTHPEVQRQFQYRPAVDLKLQIVSSTNSISCAHEFLAILLAASFLPLITLTRTLLFIHSGTKPTNTTCRACGR